MIPFSANSSRFFEKKVAQGLALSDFFGSLLYHTKNYQGTTTPFPKKIQGIQLYHTKNYLAGAAFSSAQASDGSEKCRFSACFTRTDERIPTENGG